MKIRHRLVDNWAFEYPVRVVQSPLLPLICLFRIFHSMPCNSPVVIPERMCVELESLCLLMYITLKYLFIQHVICRSEDLCIVNTYIRSRQQELVQLNILFALAQLTGMLFYHTGSTCGVSRAFQMLFALRISAFISHLPK